MSLKVFLSYDTKDLAFAQSIKARIKEILPQHNVEALDVFDAGTDWAVGEDIRQSIRSAVEKADTVLVISSKSGDLSPWVNYEAGLADALGKELVIIEQQGSEDSALLRRFLETAQVVKIEHG